MYVTIWEFRAREGCESEFEQAYGPHGIWATLFQEGQGFLGTELLHDAADPQRYITIDRWTSRSEYLAFRRRWAAEYEAIDIRCAALTESEAALGSFLTINTGR
jgi:heme-degrading monooxygenase HmoA